MERRQLIVSIACSTPFLSGCVFGNNSESTTLSSEIASQEYLCDDTIDQVELAHTYRETILVNGIISNIDGQMSLTSSIYGPNENSLICRVGTRELDNQENNCTGSVEYELEIDTGEHTISEISILHRNREGESHINDIII